MKNKIFMLILLTLVLIIIPSLCTAVHDVFKIDKVGSMLFDESRDRLYVTDKANNKLITIDTNEDKILGAKLDIGSKPMDMAISEDNEYLYIALNGGSSIVIYELDSTRYVGSIQLEKPPADLSISGNHLYVTYGDNQWDPSPSIIDLTTNEIVGSLSTRGSTYEYAMVRSHNNDVFIGETKLSPASLYKLKVEGTLATLQVEDQHGAIGSNLKDMEVTSNGDKVLLAARHPYYIQVLSTEDFRQLGQLDTGAYPNAISLDGNDEYVYATHGGNEVIEFDLNAYIKTQSFTIPIDRRSSESILDQGVVAADGKLYVVTGDRGGDTTDNIYSIDLSDGSTKSIFKKRKLNFKSVSIKHQIASGENMGFTIFVNNIGDVEEGDVKIIYTIPDLGVELISESYTIRPGEEQRISSYWPLPEGTEAGAYEMEIRLESNMGTHETIDDTLTVVENEPDTSTDIQLVNFEFLDYPVQLYPNILAIVIRNNGQQTINSEELRVFLEIDDEERQINTDYLSLDIPPQEDMVLYVFIIFTDETGNQAVKVRVEAKEPYQESTPNDNALIKNVYIQPLSTVCDGCLEAGVLWEESSETYYVDGDRYEVGIDYASPTSVRFEINGQVTPHLSKNEHYSINGDIYIVILEISEINIDQQSQQYVEFAFESKEEAPGDFFSEPRKEELPPLIEATENDDREEEEIVVKKENTPEEKWAAPTCNDKVKNNGETGIDCGGPCLPCKEEKCEGCKRDEKDCLPVGTRFYRDRQSLYCSIHNEFEEQKLDGSYCQANFECYSNICQYHKCGGLQDKRSFWDKLMDLFDHLIYAIF